MNKTHSYIVFLLFCLSMLISTVGTADRTYGPVKNKDYLSKIVNKSYPNSALTRDQLMVGILRANHDSFRGGNVHFLKIGENLTLPDEDVISLIDKDEATRTVKEHLTFFKRGRPGAFPAIPLPKVVVPESAVDEKADADEGSTEEDVSSDKKPASTEENKLEPVQESVVNAAKETEESRTKLESLESEKNQQDEVLQSLEMQIKKLEEELESTASDEKKTEEGPSPSEEEVEKEEPESSSSASDKDSLEKSTISALENNLSSNTETEVAVKEVEETPKADVEIAESVPEEPVEPIAEGAKSVVVEEKVFVEDKVEEPKAVAKDVAATQEIESSSEDSNIPWWVWIIPLFLVPLLILGLIFKSKDRVSSTDLPQIKKPKKKTATKEVLHVDASEPVIKTSSTVVESDDSYEDATPQASRGNVSASEQEVSLKIDMARAYLDMDYHDAAVEILNEVVAEGNAVQVERAREILARI